MSVEKQTPEQDPTMTPAAPAEDLTAWDAAQAAEPADIVREEDDLDDFARRVHAIPDTRWKLYNILGGAAMGVLLGVSLFILPTIDEFSNWSLLIAVALALLVPRILENRLKRSISTGRITMVIVFGALLLIQLLRGVMSGGL